MLIVAGYVRVPADLRAEYLRGVLPDTELARHAPGCLAFVQAPDPLEADRVVIYERWESVRDLLAFRNSDSGEATPLPVILGTEVLRYDVSGVGPP
ncbi:MAG: antibiotic biosynthesis monooxygenase family protein [Candidatus Nanopelagicales bacterium]